MIKGADLEDLFRVRKHRCLEPPDPLNNLRREAKLEFERLEEELRVLTARNVREGDYTGPPARKGWRTPRKRRRRERG